MKEPEERSASSAPVAAKRMLDGGSANPAISVHQPHQLLPPPTHQLLPPPTHHVGSFHTLDRSQTTVSSEGKYAETIAALEAELAEVKRKLVTAETGKTQAVREYTNIKNLLDQISQVEHFAVSDDVEVESAPLPPNWSHGSFVPTEVDRLRNELEESRNLNSKFAAELDRAKAEIDLAEQHKSANFKLLSETRRLRSELEAGRGREESLTADLENAKNDIRTLQENLSDSWNKHGLELARAKEEIAWLDADLAAARSLTVELARAKAEYHTLHGDLAAARRLHETSSHEHSEEISRLQSQHAASTSILILRNRQLQEDIEDLRLLHETSTVNLENAKEVISVYERESVHSKEEISRLQEELSAVTAEGRESATMLRELEDKNQELVAKLEDAMGQYYNSCMELSEATEHIDKLIEERDTLRVKYESCHSELFEVNEKIYQLKEEHRTSHEDLVSDITAAQEENEKLQAEVTVLKDEKMNLTMELAKGREDSQVELDAVYGRNLELSKECARLQSELGALQEQHGDCCKELECALTEVEKLHDVVTAVLAHADEEVGRLQLDFTVEAECALKMVRVLKEEISKVQFDLSLQYSNLLVEKSGVAKKLEEVSLELLATNARLQEATAAQEKAEAELAEQVAAANAQLALLDTVQAELVTAREAESMLQVITQEVEDLKAELASNKESMETSSELRASMDDLHIELNAIKKSEAKYREAVTSSQAQIEDIKTHFYALRDSEAEAKESLVFTTYDLQKVSIELAIAKEALEWVSGDNAALTAELAIKNAELEARTAEVVCTKEGEAKAKAAFMDYSLKVQKMRLDLQDASKLVDKARGIELNLDEVAAKLEKAAESERTMSTSMASLKAELNNAKAELATTQEDHRRAFAEKEHQYEAELNQMRTQWEVAVMSEAEDASINMRQATQEVEKLRQVIEELQAHIETLEARLETLQLEVEAAKQSEEWAFAQMRLKTIPEYDGEMEDKVETSISWEEYSNLKMKAKGLQEVVDKRAAMGVAEVNEARASEKEMQIRMHNLEKDLASCRDDLIEAINKREEAEAAKFSCEAQLRTKRLERKSLSHSGHLNGGVHSSGKYMNVGDRQGSLNGICFEDSQSSSSPSCSSFSIASFASLGQLERSPTESIAQVLTTRMPSMEKQRKNKLSSKIGQYFTKKKILV